MEKQRAGSSVASDRGVSRRAVLLSLSAAATMAAATSAGVASVTPAREPQGPQNIILSGAGAAGMVGAVPGAGETVVEGTGTAAIQAAVDAAPPGGVVRIPSGSRHAVHAVELPDKDVILAVQGATIETTARGEYAFVQRNRRKLSVLGGVFTGVGSGIRFILPQEEQQSYDFSANGVTFSLPVSETAIRLTGVREATITECAFAKCTGIWLDETVNTHVVGSQFRDCRTGVFADGGATGSPYNAGLMMTNVTMLGCASGVAVRAWDWASIVNSMIDYCDRPVVLVNVDGAVIDTSYLSNRNVASGPSPVLEVLTDPALPGGPAQHVKVSNCQVISHADRTPDRSIGIRVDGAQWFSLTNTTVHFWHRFGVLVSGASPNLRLQGNVLNPAPGAPDPVALQGTGGDDASWIIAENTLNAAVREVRDASMRDNV